MNYLLEDANHVVSIAIANPITKRIRVPVGSKLIGAEWVVNPHKYDIAVCTFDGQHLQLDPVKQAAKSSANIKIYTESILSNAMDFGKKLIVEFGAENMRMNITQLGKTNEVRIALNGVMSALLAGSLYDAITEVKKIPVEAKDATFVTDIRLLVFVNKIEDYLHTPRSTHL